MDAADYCRDIEAYLCQRNEGHLVRISGPAFELVCNWARTGVPIKVAFQGIDRHLQRLEHRGPRRRPVRIEFCEADVMDAFDAWRRAVGVRAAAPDTSTGEAEAETDDAPVRRRSPLAAQLSRAIGRLVALRSGPAVSSVWDAVLDGLVRGPDAMQAGAKTARGDRREALLAELARDAEQELAPFAARMPAAAYRDAMGRATHRLVRDRLALPSLAMD